MTKQNKALHLKDIVGLLSNQQFITDSRDYWDHYGAQSERIGHNKTEWERQAPAFMSKFLDPFMTKWRGAYPPPSELLISPLWQKTQTATMTGRWGIIPVYPWTTEKEVKHQTRQIQKAIGKKYKESKAYSRALIAQWLSDSHICSRTNEPPGSNNIAAAVWGQRKDSAVFRKRKGLQIYLKNVRES